MDQEVLSLLGNTLDDAELRFQAVVESVAEGLAVFDTSGTLIFCNSQFEQLTGFNRNEIYGKRIYEIFFPPGSPEQDQYLKDMLTRYRARQDGIREVYHTQIYRKNGERRFVETKAAPFVDKSGRILGSIGANTDITERLQMEEMLRRSQRMEAVGSFAGGIAQGFNNSLTVIACRTDMLLESPLAEQENLHHLQLIKHAVAAAGRLTRQLSTINQPSANSPVPVDINEIARSAAGEMRQMLPESVFLDLVLGERLSLVSADAMGVKQVVIDLMMCFYRSDSQLGRSRSTISMVTGEEVRTADLRPAEDDLPAGRYVTLTIRHRMLGNDFPDIPSLLESFSTKGCDIIPEVALSASNTIVNKFGGRLRSTREANEDLCFKVILPALAGQFSFKKKPQLVVEANESEASILVVEPNDEVRALLVELLLKQKNYQVHGVGSLSEAYQLLNKSIEPFSLILADTGAIEALDYSSAKTFLRTRQKTGLLLLSGRALSPELLQLVEEAEVPLITKPFSSSVFLQNVQAALEQRGKQSRVWRRQEGVR